jgi:hypothetical protein
MAGRTGRVGGAVIAIASTRGRTRKGEFEFMAISDVRGLRRGGSVKLALAAATVAILAGSGIGLAQAACAGSSLAQEDCGSSRDLIPWKSEWNFTGNWPPSVDIKPYVKCVATTYVTTEKAGSDMTECTGDGFDRSYWADFAGNVNGVSIITAMNMEGYQQKARTGDGCPTTSADHGDYVKCIKVPGPNGGRDGVVFSVESRTGTRTPSTMHVNWDYGW